MADPVSLDARLGVDLGGFSLDVSLQVEAATVTAILGPNGAGKTTALGCLSGRLALDRGCIELAGRTLDDPSRGRYLRPEQRRVGFVHQDLMLFPHLSVIDNVAFAPRCAGVDRRRARQGAMGWLERVGLQDHAASRPQDLSGGQAQRVALARALITDPDLLLLDEPLSALDANARATTRRDLGRHLDGFDGPTLVVTHDPLDALTLADRVVVLERGTVTQEGPIADVTTRPRTGYVADLIGTNLLSGNGRGRRVDAGGATVEVAEAIEGPTFLTISPRAVTISAHRPDTSARNVWPVTVSGIDLLGDRVRVAVAGPPDLVGEITPAALSELGLDTGTSAWVSVKATEVSTYLR